MHHRISGLFHRRQKDGKPCHEADDPSCLPFYEEAGDRSSQKPHRLTRCDGLRGLRNADDFDSGRFYPNNATDSSLESALSAFNAASPLPSISKVGSPLPSPPRSPVLASQPTSLWPLPSPRQFPKKCDDHEMRPNGFPVNHWDTGNALPVDNFNRHSPLVGLPVSSALKTGGKPFGSSGAGLPAYPITKQVDRSSNEWISNSLQSPKGTRIPKEPWNWTSDRVMYEDRIAADDNLTPTYNLQNGRVQKNIGYPPPDVQAIALSSVPSPPLSPTSNRALSPGGWIKGHLLGSGAFGRVYKGIHSGTGEFCAIKEVEFEQSEHRSREAAEQLKKEIVSLSSLQHPNIVQYKGSELVGDNLYIYLELISGGSLYKLYQEFKKLEEPVIRRYTRQILLGLAYLHGRKFVHRDIKCANILVDQDGTIKLADFGVSKYIKEQGAPFSLKGSPHWMAPEVIMATNTGYEYALDIWSLGCTVIEMVMGRPPWSDLEAAAAMFKITKVGAPPIPHTLSAEGKSFVKLCLQKRPADRPTASVLLEHPFVKIPNEMYHNVGHAFEAINNVLEHNEGRPASPVSSALAVYPSLSAPSSPRSSYRPANDTLYTQKGLEMHHRGSAHSGNVESRNHTYDSYPSQERLRQKPKAGIPPTGRRRSHEFSHAQPRPSLSAPASPKSPRMHGNLYPSLSADILPGYPTPFSESRGI